MKRILLFIAIAVCSASISGQQIYNGTFNTWSSPTNPDGWGTWASAVGGVVGDSMIRLAARDSLITDQARYPDDSVSVRMSVDTITLPAQGQVTLAGFISYGGAFYNAFPDTPVGIAYGYYPYGAYPDSLIFDYRFVPAPGHNDTAYAFMTMIRFDSASQTEVYYLDQYWLLDTTSSWTHLALPLNYLVHDTFLPDSIQIVFISSISQNPSLGTSLWLDTIHFDASVDPVDTTSDTLGIVNVRNIRGVKTWPNPANDQLHLLVQASEVGSSEQLYDASGRQVYSSTIDQADYIIDTRCLPDGIYSLRVHSTDRLTVYSGKVTVLHSQ